MTRISGGNAEPPSVKTLVMWHLIADTRLQHPVVGRSIATLGS